MEHEHELRFSGGRGEEPTYKKTDKHVVALNKVTNKFHERIEAIRFLRLPVWNPTPNPGTGTDGSTDGTNRDYDGGAVLITVLAVIAGKVVQS